MSVRHFDLDQVTVMVANIPITEWATGDALTITYREADWVTTQGHHGSVIRAKMPNVVADVKMTLMQGSPVNELLSQLSAADKASGLGAGAFFVKDLNGTTQASGTRSWVEKHAEGKLGTEPGSVEWPVTVGDLTMTVGQNRLL